MLTCCTDASVPVVFLFLLPVVCSDACRPYSGSTLAVGCQTGVLLWQVRCHPGAPR